MQTQRQAVGFNRLQRAIGMAIAAWALGVSAPLAAQDITDTSSNDAWSGAIELSAAPLIGRSAAPDTDTSPVDESEYEINFALKRKGRSGLTNLQLKAGIVSDPQWLDDADASSAIYSEVTVGDEFIPLPELERYAVTLKGSSIRPYGRFRISRKFTNFLDTYNRTDKQLTGGVRFRDEVVTSRGVYWEARVEGNQVWSTNDDKSLFKPLVRGDVYSSPTAVGRLFGRAQYDVKFYEDARVASGKKRTDRTVTLTGGLVLDNLFAKISDAVSGAVGVKWQKVSSNDPDARYSRWYFAPSLTVTAKFR